MTFNAVGNDVSFTDVNLILGRLIGVLAYKKVNAGATRLIAFQCIANPLSWRYQCVSSPIDNFGGD